MRRLFIGLVLVALASVGLTTTADAATYKWNNTSNEGRDLRVEFCDGKKGEIYQSTDTSRDVCKVYIPYKQKLYVYVAETGTVLFNNVIYCGPNDGKWYKLNSKNDTKRTAVSNLSSYVSTYCR